MVDSRRMEDHHKQFKLERLGDGELFVEVTCQNCRAKFTINMDCESIRERMDEHAKFCSKAKATSANPK